MIHAKILWVTSIFFLLLVGCAEGGTRTVRGDVSSTDGTDSSTSTSSDSSTGGGDTEPSSTDSESEVDTGPITSPECDNEGELYCDSECMLPHTDEHCRSCNRACSAGRVCRELDNVWDCRCPADALLCGGACVDPQTDEAFCGATGTCVGVEAGANCGAGGACVKGVCRCDSEHTKCDGECVNTQTDSRYCGSTPDKCGVQCMTGGACVEGGCECPATAPTECNIGCVNTDIADGACGGCVESGGEACDTANGYACIDGSCQCAPGLTLCDGKCTDTTSDPDNCGGCYDGGLGTGILCDYVDPPTNTIRQSCFADQCVNSPCDPAVMGTLCDGLTLLKNDVCYTSDDQFVGAAIKCDNNNTSLHPSGIPLNTTACYEISNAEALEEFRCWWSGRNLTVNGTLMICNNSGTNFLPLPPSVGGGYCVYFPMTGTPGSETDGFAIGNR